MSIIHKESGRVIARQVEHMRDAKTRTIGMLKFSQAPSHYGAVFALPLFGFFPLVHTVGMRFPIDILFCSGDGKIFFIRKQVPPGKFVLPWAQLLGGARYLVEFSGCDLEGVQVDEHLLWEAA